MTPPRRRSARWSSGGAPRPSPRSIPSRSPTSPRSARTSGSTTAAARSSGRRSGCGRRRVPAATCCSCSDPSRRCAGSCSAPSSSASPSELGARMSVSLGALLADVPHTRPVQIIGTASDPELIDRFELQRSRYEGPTGIVGVLHDAMATAGIAVASLWAAVPQYAAQVPSPKAALALVERACGLIGSPRARRRLRRRGRRVRRPHRRPDRRRRRPGRLRQPPRVVRRRRARRPTTMTTTTTPAAALDAENLDELVAEVEQFLRDRDPE